MNKLILTAAAVVSAGICLADVQSANVVGYASTNTVQKFNQITPMFVDVADSSGYNICNLGSNFALGDTIQIFNKDGNVEIRLTWKSRKGNTGWHNDANDYLTNYIVNKGKCVWIYTAGPISITQSGAVFNKEYTLTFGQKFNQAGNPTPVDLKLSQLTFTGMDLGDTIQIFNKDGNVETRYTWKSRKGNTGWHNDANDYIPDQIVPAGQAFWVYCANAGATMTIPKIID